MRIAMGLLSACGHLAAELITRDLVNNQRRVGYHAFDEPEFGDPDADGRRELSGVPGAETDIDARVRAAKFY